MFAVIPNDDINRRINRRYSKRRHQSMTTSIALSTRPKAYNLPWRNNHPPVARKALTTTTGHPSPTTTTKCLKVPTSIWKDHTTPTTWTAGSGPIPGNNWQTHWDSLLLFQGATTAQSLHQRFGQANYSWTTATEQWNRNHHPIRRNHNYPSKSHQAGWTEIQQPVQRMYGNTRSRPSMIASAKHTQLSMDSATAPAMKAR